MATSFFIPYSSLPESYYLFPSFQYSSHPCCLLSLSTFPKLCSALSITLLNSTVQPPHLHPHSHPLMLPLNTLLSTVIHIWWPTLDQTSISSLRPPARLVRLNPNNYRTHPHSLLSPSSTYFHQHHLLYYTLSNL